MSPKPDIEIVQKNVCPKCEQNLHHTHYDNNVASIEFSKNGCPMGVHHVSVNPRQKCECKYHGKWAADCHPEIGSNDPVSVSM